MNLTLYSTIFALMHRTSTYHVITVVWTFIMLTLWAQDFNLNTLISSLGKYPTTSTHKR